jgi:hypothetical protein
MKSDCIYHRSLDCVEIDITYKCNLKCHNCNRSCDIINSDDVFEINQIRKFLENSVINNKIWRRIRLLGGEPTLHPDFLEILKLIYQYKIKHNKELLIEITTNNISIETKELLKIYFIKSNVVVNISYKTDFYLDEFVNIYNAPIDNSYFKEDNFEAGCVISQNCGIGLNLYGFYPCAISANIDRILGLNIGRKVIPSDDDTMLDLLKIFCKSCGYYKYYRDDIIKNEVSHSWKKVFEKYFDNKPVLTKIYIQ